MPKTTRAQPGRLSSRFWKLLGASTEKDRSRSLTQVNDSSEYDGEAAGLSDEQLRKAAGLLNLEDLADSEDIRSSSPSPARPPNGRAGCGRSTFSCSGRCGCWPAT